MGSRPIRTAPACHGGISDDAIGESRQWGDGRGGFYRHYGDPERDPEHFYRQYGNLQGERQWRQRYRHGKRERVNGDVYAVCQTCLRYRLHGHRHHRGQGGKRGGERIRDELFLEFYDRIGAASTDTDVISFTLSESDTDADAKDFTGGITDTDTSNNAHAVVLTVATAIADAKVDADSVAHTVANGVTVTNTISASNADTHTNADAVANTITAANANADTKPNTHANTGANADPGGVDEQEVGYYEQAQGCCVW